MTGKLGPTTGYDVSIKLEVKFEYLFPDYFGCPLYVSTTAIATLDAFLLIVFKDINPQIAGTTLRWDRVSMA